MAEWVEIIVPVGAADVDDVAALIASDIGAASAGTELRGDEVVFWVQPEHVAAALAETRDAVTRWAAGGAALDPARVRSATAMPEAEWRDAWKRYFKVSRLTRQIVVVPSWEHYDAQPGDVIVELDPGMAFGTGTHASTRLVLDELQDVKDAGLAPARIADVGCGSGILSIAAVKLWPDATVVAIDNDPIAIAATAENAAHNRVGDKIFAGVNATAMLAEQFALVLANIQAHVLRELKPALLALIAPNGTLILSGLLAAQAQPLADEFAAAGMRIVKIRPSTVDAQWSSVVLAK
ncbi:MAG TPA: 50S ribosomal protein L11 methyltransferase [Kofleriaceae bacterium]|nr:50S ribosomal protein L11 methyltransferase [Kofleriaceae bacterium]